MRTSLSLQRSLFRHQQRQIERIVSFGSAAFQHYEKRYRRATSRYARALAPNELKRRVRQCDIIYVGDYHTLKLAQQTYLSLVEQAIATGRRVVLALELVEKRHQDSLNAFLKKKLGEKRFLERIGHPYRGPFDIWPNFRPIFTLASACKLEVRAIDSRGRGAQSLHQRDVAAAKIIAELAGGPDAPLVLVLMGQFHIAAPHLPHEVDQLLAKPRQSLIVYQNAEGIWWRLAERGLAHRTSAVHIDERSICLINASPVECQRSFLDYVEAEAGDAPIDERGIASSVKHLARRIGRLAGVKVARQVADLEVLTSSDWSVLERISKRGRFSREEMKHLEKHVLSGESAFIPQANTIWLASLSLNHAAEEATHFVRHCAIGATMYEPRRRVDAFWSRCLEEALGFLGSKLVNPARQVPSLESFKKTFQAGSDEDRRVAAFVLAISSTQGESEAELRRLLPLGAMSVFNGVTHGLGYLLGDSLYRAYENERVTNADVRAMFADPLVNPYGTWHSWRSLSRHGRLAA